MTRPSEPCDSTLWAGSRCAFTCTLIGLHPSDLHRCGSVEWDDLDAFESVRLWGPGQNGPEATP